MPDEEPAGGSRSHHDAMPTHGQLPDNAGVSPHLTSGESGRQKVTSSELIRNGSNQAVPGGREEDAAHPEQYRSYQSGLSNDARSTGDDSAPNASFDPMYQDFPAGSYPKGSKRRTPRQQEQNKHAQQRYRAKRKAHFDELQGTVGGLMAELQASEREKRALELEVHALRRREAERLPGGETSAEPVDVLIQNLVSRGVIPPTAVSMRMPPPAPPPPAVAAAPSPPPAITPTFSPETIHQMLGAFKSELWAFLTANNLFYPARLNSVSSVPPASTIPPTLLPQVIDRVKMGIELAKLVINVSGPGSQLVLLGDGALAPAATPCAADETTRWQEVVVAVAPTPKQVMQIASLRNNVIFMFHSAYTARMELKTAGFQSLGVHPDGKNRWAEEILLHAASNAGYGLLAQANSELFDCAEKLKVSVDADRAQIGTALFELLMNILSPLQAVKYLAKSHPFSWNVLAFFNFAAAGSG